METTYQNIAETTPLLTNDAESQPNQQKRCFPILWTWKTWVLLGSIFSVSILLIFMIVIYTFIIPNKIQLALNGNNSNLQKLQILNISDSIHMVVGLEIAVESSPFNVNFEAKEMELYTDDYTDGMTGLAKFTFPSFDIPPSSTSIYTEFDTSIKTMNIPFISWFLTRNVRHGFHPLTAHLTGHPVIRMWFGSWIGNLSKSYSLTKTEFDYKQLNASAKVINQKVEETKQGTKYYLTVLGSFLNPSQVSILKQDTSVEFSVFYKECPILLITLPSLQLLRGNNTQKVFIESNPRYNMELMTFIGLYADGHDQNIDVKDIKIDIDWIQDMVIGWDFPIFVPGAKEQDNFTRNTYGLRHQDYERYRHYCTRKIQRVRKVTGQQQRKKKYEKKDLLIDSRSLEICLFEAERAWSFAMELKQQSSEQPRKKFHLIKRLKKACKSCQDLTAIAEAVGVDALTTLEIQAYGLVMNAYLLFEACVWDQAMDKFASARTLYEKIGSSVFHENLCQAAIDEIDPSIRYCAYNLRIKGGRSLDIGEILQMQSDNSSQFLSAQLESLLTSSTKSLGNSFKWRGKEFTIWNPKLVESIFVFEKYESLVDTKNEMDHFDKTLGAMWEASKLVEKAVNEDLEAVAKVSSSKSKEKTDMLLLASSYIGYSRLSTTIKRNVALIKANRIKFEAGEKKIKTDDNVKLCLGIQRILKEMSKLSINEVDSSFSGFLEALESIFETFKIFSFAEMYMFQEKYQEALYLVEYAISNINTSKWDTVKKLGVEEQKELSYYQRLLDDLQSNLARDQIINTCKIYLQQNHLEARGDDSSLINKINVYSKLKKDDVPKLVEIPPNFMTAAPKPIYFDLAYSGIEYPLENIKKLALGQDPLQKEPVEAKESESSFIRNVFGIFGTK